MISLINSSTNIKETLKQIFTLVIEQDISARIPKGCFMVNSAIELSASHTDIANIVAQSQKDIENAFEKAILKGQASGSLKSNLNAKQLSHFFYNSISGLRVSLKYNTNPTYFKEIVALNLSLLST